MSDIVPINEHESPIDLMPPPDAFAIMTPEQIDRMVQVADKVAEARQKLMHICIRRAEPKDFVDFGGKPYLQGCGADRIAGVIGLRFSEPRFDVRWEGEDVFVEASGEVTWAAINYRTSVLGACSTLDKFYSGSTGDGATMAQCLARCNNDRKLASLQLLGHVKKKAYENWKSRAVSSILGIRNMTWERLSVFGFTKDGAGASVEYKKGGQRQSPAPQPQPQPQPQRSHAPAPERSLSDLASLVEGDTASVRAVVVRFKEEKVGANKTDVLRVWLTGPAADGGVLEIRCSQWGTAPLWLVDGMEVSASLKVGKPYKGEAQYTILEMECIDDGNSRDAAADDHAG